MPDCRAVIGRGGDQPPAAAPFPLPFPFPLFPFPLLPLPLPAAAAPVPVSAALLGAVAAVVAGVLGTDDTVGVVVVVGLVVVDFVVGADDVVGVLLDVVVGVVRVVVAVAVVVTVCGATELDVVGWLLVVTAGIVGSPEVFGLTSAITATTAKATRAVVSSAMRNTRPVLLRGFSGAGGRPVAVTGGTG